MITRYLNINIRACGQGAAAPCLFVAMLLFSVCAFAQTPASKAAKQEQPGRPVVIQGSVGSDEAKIQCANLIYAGTKTSKCFSDKFMGTVARETNIVTDRRFSPVKLSSDELFKYPFAVMTGEQAFRLLEQERVNLRSYLLRGGFLLASAGCSSKEWNQSFRTEIKRIFPNTKLKKVPMDHKLFSTVFNIRSIRLAKSSGSASLEGLEVDGRIVMIYSQEGLNDTGNAGKGCCCCGGNEVQNSQEVNVNVITYALTH